MNRDYEGEKLAGVYEELRPDYPDDIRRVVLASLERNSSLKAGKRFLLDVGCGGGKSTKLFVSDFDKILGIDISSAQIDVARKKMKYSEHVQFQVVNDNRFPVEDESVDMVLCATALHYMDPPTFFAECDRVLVDGGIVAVTLYYKDTLRSMDGTLIGNMSDEKCEYRRSVHEFFKSCRMDDKSRERFLDLYKSIYDNIENPTKRWETQTSVELEWTVCQFLRSMETIAGYYENRHLGFCADPLEEFSAAMSKIFMSHGLKFEMDARLIVTIAMPVLIIEKKNGHKIK